MPRMTYDDARNLCAAFEIIRNPLPEWHAIDRDQKEKILKAANEWRYRKPTNANGSKGRYFCEYLRRTLESDK